jgi:type I restriction enzyme S subunit
MEANFNYTGRAHVGHDNMGNIKIALPKINEQIKIASILSNVDKIIESCVFKNEKLKLLKKGLMQQLLTGKIRVKV